MIKVNDDTVKNPLYLEHYYILRASNVWVEEVIVCPECELTNYIVYCNDCDKRTGTDLNYVCRLCNVHINLNIKTLTATYNDNNTR